MNLTRLEIASVLILALGCATLGYRLKSADMPRAEGVSAAPQRAQADGSVVAERKPLAKPPKAPHALPKGSTEERRIAVTVKPKQPDCDPVRIDLSLIREGDGRRVVASSPDGAVVSALDLPIVAGLVPPPARPWAAGASYNVQTGRAGAWIERDVSRLRVGADLVQEQTGELAVVARVGWRW